MPWHGNTVLTILWFLDAYALKDECDGAATNAILDSTSSFSSPKPPFEGACGGASSISTLSGEFQSTTSTSSERSCISGVWAVDCNSDIDIRSNSWDRILGLIIGGNLIPANGTRTFYLIFSEIAPWCLSLLYFIGGVSRRIVPSPQWRIRRVLSNGNIAMPKLIYELNELLASSFKTFTSCTFKNS